MLSLLIKGLLAGLMCLHGLIHLMGAVNELGWARVAGLSGKTIVFLPGVMHTMLGILWLAAAVMFLAAALGLFFNTSWWRPLIIATVAVSQVLVIIWWPDAKAGTIPNVIILLASLLWKIA